MKRAYQYIVELALGFALVIALGSCDVHEWPEPLPKEPVVVRLAFETGIPQWEYYIFSRSCAIPETKGWRDNGTMRYVIRVCPLENGQIASRQYADEFVFFRNVADGYDHEFTLNIAPGKYKMMVWADLSEDNGAPTFYDAGNFAEITLQGEHRANTDYRDAFRGTLDFEVTATPVAEHASSAAKVVDVMMQRPLAKFEFVTNDLQEFRGKESMRINGRNAAQDEVSTRSEINLSDYCLVFQYVGYMPCAYSMYTDKPVDSKTGVRFESYFTQIDDNEASLGFDYVFVNGTETAVTVQIALYNNEGEQLSLTDPIDVPLRRSTHTIIRGSFLLTQASGGVGIEPGFEGDHNVVIP